MVDMSLLHSSGILSSAQQTMVNLLSGLLRHPPPPPPAQPPTPVFQPNRRGIVYDGHDHGQAWNCANAITSTSPPADGVDGAAASVDLDADEISLTDGVKTVDELEDLFNKAAESPDNDSLFKVMASTPREPRELVVGEDEDEDSEEADRARRDKFCVDPHQAVADAIADSFFDGLTWDAVQGERPRIVLPSRKFLYEKYGNPSCSCQMRSMESTERLCPSQSVSPANQSDAPLMYPWS